MEGIVVELDRAQVDQVVRAASQGGAVSVVLAGLRGVRATLARESKSGRPLNIDNRGLSHSLLSGLMVLASLPADGSYLGIAEIAQLTGMNKSTTHRYISTLLAVALVVQDPRTRKYRSAGNSAPARG